MVIRPHPEELAELLEESRVPLVLDHAGTLEGLRQPTFIVGRRFHTDEETPFSLPTRANHPFGTQAFLLITCTDRIFTHH